MLLRKEQSAVSALGFDKNSFDQIQPLPCVDCHLGDSGTPKGLDFRLILDLKLMAKKRRLQPRSVHTDQVHANHETCKGNGPLGHGSDPQEH